MTGYVGIPDHILRTANIVLRPGRDIGLPPTPAVRVKIVDKRSPALAHQIAEVCVRLTLVLERVHGVTQTVDVVEDKGNLLEMRHLVWPGATGGDGVEAIAVRRHVCGSPCLAG